MRGSTSGAERRVADGPRPPDGRSESEGLVQAARHVLERRGGDGFTVHEVLSEAGLGTRAFYRHFSSKEALVLAVFAEGAERERARLEARMAGAGSPTEAVTAWIESRLELAFDEEVADSMRVLSLEAQLAVDQAPEQLAAAFDCMSAPLVRQLAQGRQDGSSPGSTRARRPGPARRGVGRDAAPVVDPRDRSPPGPPAGAPLLPPSHRRRTRRWALVRCRTCPLRSVATVGPDPTAVDPAAGDRHRRIPRPSEPIEEEPWTSGLADATVVVAGGTAGMGRAAADCFAADGARVAVLARSRRRPGRSGGGPRRRSGSPDAVGLAGRPVRRGRRSIGPWPRWASGGDTSTPWSTRPGPLPVG